MTPPLNHSIFNNGIETHKNAVPALQNALCGQKDQPVTLSPLTVIISVNT
jgi:hypothetical protein